MRPPKARGGLHSVMIRRMQCGAAHFHSSRQVVDPQLDLSDLGIDYVDTLFQKRRFYDSLGLLLP